MEANNHFNYGTHPAASANSGLKRSLGDSLYTNGSSVSFPQQGKSEYFTWHFAFSPWYWIQTNANNMALPWSTFRGIWDITKGKSYRLIHVCNTKQPKHKITRLVERWCVWVWGVGVGVGVCGLTNSAQRTLTFLCEILCVYHESYSAVILVLWHAASPGRKTCSYKLRTSVSVQSRVLMYTGVPQLMYIADCEMSMMNWDV